MTPQRFKYHYCNLVVKKQWLEAAKNNLEFNGDKVLKPLEYHKKLGLYNDQISKYERLQETLMSAYAQEILDSL